MAIPTPMAGAARPNVKTQDPGRRLNPRIIDSDWLLMRDLRKAVAQVAAEVARPGMKTLDFGCGSKPYEPIFKARGVTYVGADFDGGAEILIDERGLIQTPADTADLVVSFQVLEHVRDLETYFSEAKRVLAQDGRMILSTHGTWLYHPHPEDHRRWTRQGLVNEIERNGFAVEDCTAVVGPLAWTTIIRLTCWCYGLKKVPVLGGALAAALALVMNLRALVEEAITPKWVTRDNACVYVVLCRSAAAVA